MAAARCWFSLSLLLTASLALAQVPKASPARLILDPNGILKPSDPLLIKVEGVPQGTAVRLRVLQDCNADGRPETTPQGECVNPLFERDSTKAGLRNLVEDRLNIPELVASGTAFPQERALWLRIGEPGAGYFLQARFAIAADPCSFFATVFDTFLRGDCRLGLPQVLRAHRGAVGMLDTSFEVRVVTVGEAIGEPRSVPGTRGATGVAWLDQQTLLFTSGVAAGDESPAAGLYRIRLHGEEPPQLLQAAEKGHIASAPFLLGDGRYAFVEQTPGPQQPGACAGVARLVVGRGGKVQQRVELPYKIHQLLASDAEGTELLALTLGVSDNHPTLLTIDLNGAPANPARPTVQVIGFDSSVYAAALREPGGERSVVALENAFLPHGWQLMWVDATGKSRDLVKRKQNHDLLPSWRPGGADAAFLAEVERP